MRSYGMFLKVLLLGVSLVLVLVAMNSLKRDGFGPGFLAFFGLSAPTPLASGHVRSAKMLSSLDWCETRVVALEDRVQNLRLLEEKMRWYLEKDSKPREAVDAIAAEKWFGRYCRVQVEKVPQEALGTELSDVLKVEFVKGPSRMLQKSPSGIYVWQGQAFRSSELDRALSSLSELPTATHR